MCLRPRLILTLQPGLRALLTCHVTRPVTCHMAVNRPLQPLTRARPSRITTDPITRLKSCGSLGSHLGGSAWQCRRRRQHSLPQRTTKGAAAYVHRLHRLLELVFFGTAVLVVQWHVCIADTIGTQLGVLYTVEPLYRGHHWDPAGCPVYSGTSL